MRRSEDIRGNLIQKAKISSVLTQPSEAGSPYAARYVRRVIDYRCDDRRFWLSAHNCQVQTPTSQNIELEQKIRIFGAD
jgi:hypothetical protein